MRFPLDFLDISILLAGTAIILLITSLVVSTYYGKVNILINRKKLKNATITVSILFLVFAAIRITEIILNQ